MADAQAAAGDGLLVEAVPNVSEGRRVDVIRAIADAARHVPDSYVLDVHSDADHHRSVVTMVGTARGIAEASFALAAAAVGAIDLREHEGVHPRIGALDVLPFVPLGDTPMSACIRLAHDVGARIAKELEVPVYFYGEAALRPERRRLADIRRGGYERLVATIGSDPGRQPDAGPPVIGPAGATVVGARPPLVAFNALLATDDLGVAQAVARAIRESSGGLKGVQALGLRLPRAGKVQVSLNVTNLGATPLHVVMRRLQAEAGARGVQVAGTELVGLMPLESALEAAASELALPRLASGQIIETALARAVSERSPSTSG